MAGSPPMTPVNLFYSYAHEDEALRDELRGHLKILERRGLLASWHDRQITAGQDWHAQIDQALQLADLVLLLVSKDFIDSDYIVGTELTVAMQRHQAGLATVVPVFVRAVNIEDEDRDAFPFLQFQGLPTGLRPVTSWPNRDEAWTDVAKGLRATVKAIHARKAEGTAPRPSRGGRRMTGPGAATGASGAADPLLLQVIDGVESIVDQANAARGAVPFDRQGMRDDALALIDVPEQKRVLWVDDNPGNNRLEIAALARLQIEVEAVTSTAAALAALTAPGADFDLVIADWVRPEDSGLDWVARMPAGGAQVPVVLYHGETRDPARSERARRAAEAGAFGEAAAPSELLRLVLGALTL